MSNKVPALPRIVLVALGLLFLGLALAQWGPYISPEPTAQAQRPTPIIFIVVETLRADHLQAYGYARNTMPNLENLARDGVIFEKAIVAAPWTLPSVSSILSGLPPTAHGVRRYEDILPDDVETLAEIFQKRGYYTAFYGVNSLFEADRNLEQGFDHYYGIDEIPGTQLNERLAAFFQDRPQDRPFFLYAHYFEPHCRYEPPKDLHEMYWPPPEGLKTGRRMSDEQLRTMHECFHLNRQSGEPILELDYYLSEYDAELRYVDHLIGIFIERLKTADLYDQSLIVFVGDHGEEFWEHETFGHGRSLNESAIHVPLFIKPPKDSPIQRHPHPVSTLDLAPTALASAGLPVPDMMPGQDLSPLWNGPQGAVEAKAIFSETDYDAHAFRSIHWDGYKLILPLKGGSPRLFRLEDAAKNAPELSRSNPAQTTKLLEALTEHMQKSEKIGRALGHKDEPLSQDIIEELTVLGYTF